MNDYKYVTNEIFPHGLGTRISLLLNAITYSIIENKEFIFTPFSYQTSKLEFNSNPMTKRVDYPESCRRWDTLLNLDGKLITDIPNELSSVLYLSHPSINNTPLSGDDGYVMFNKIRNLRDNIKRDYFKIPPKNKDKKLSVSVHIRRDDAININSRFVSNEYYINTINILEDFLKTNNKEYELSIYTQKNGFNIKGFEKYKIIYDSDMTDNECWVNMLNSDIIIGGNSAFSTSIGMLTDGIFIHTQTDNLPLMDDWLYGSELTHDKLKMYI